jgi:hypothetical protein
VGSGIRPGVVGVDRGEKSNKVVMVTIKEEGLSTGVAKERRSRKIKPINKASEPETKKEGRHKVALFLQ